MILECPFCHHAKPRVWHRWGNPTEYYDKVEKVWKTRDLWYVKCPECKMQGPMLPSKEQAIDVWNMIREIK